MNHTDHINLLRGCIPNPSGVWADLGSGSGAFTLALAELIGIDGEIYSVDQDGGVLGQQKREMQARFPKIAVHYQQADFTRRLTLPALDGLVMANSLHFHRQKEGILGLVQDYLKPGGRLILVEYNTDQGNTWVPYPLSYPTWEKLAGRMGFKDTRLLADRPSRFLHSIYSAVSMR